MHCNWNETSITWMISNGKWKRNDKKERLNVKCYKYRIKCIVGWIDICGPMNRASCVALCYNVFCEIFFWFSLMFVCSLVWVQFGWWKAFLPQYLPFSYKMCTNLRLYVGFRCFVVSFCNFLPIVVRMEYLMKSILHFLPTFFLRLHHLLLRLHSAVIGQLYVFTLSMHKWNFLQ